MRTFDVQGIEIVAPRRKVFEFLREPVNLPRCGDGRIWRKSVDDEERDPASDGLLVRRVCDASSPVSDDVHLGFRGYVMQRHSQLAAAHRQ